jgi:succinate-acetate transporter protein
MKDDGPKITTTSLIDRTANPAPIALMGFGMTTILLSLVNAGIVQLGAAVVAMGIFFGGLAQVIVGFLEWKKGNTFGATTFVSFGFFWIVLIAIMLLPKLGLAAAETGVGMGWFLGLWGVFTLYMTIGTINTNRVLQLTFAVLTVLFFMLAIADAFVIPDLKVLAGFLGILPGAGAIYMAMGQVLNEALGRTVVPMFPVNGKTTKPIEKGSSTH